MATDESTGNWTSLILLERFRDGDDAAAEALFSRYFARLTSLARSRLSARLARRTDPEDIVLSVYRSFFLDARAGRFTLSRGGDLWRLLASITKHKLLRQARYYRADRRSVDAEMSLDQAGDGLLLIPDREPTPDDAAALADELEHAFSRLDPLGQRVLELRLQGANLSEIAADTGRSERTIRRALGRIRERVCEQRADCPTQSDFEFQSSAELEPIRLEELTDLRASLGPATSEPTLDPIPGVAWLSHHDVLLQRMIGSGRMGKVYQAWQQSEGRVVAVKFLRKTFLRQPGVVQRFIGEGRMIARLRHPNIVGIHGLGCTPGGSYFLVMELVSGPNLDELCRTGGISVHEVMRWAVQACNALEHAHSRGIIHCDLKPANLLRDEDGSLRVTDFGLSRSIGEPTPWTAEIEGTAPFMAPEQVSPCWGPIDARTDVYGLGAVFFTLLTGRPPWVGRRLPDILADVISARPVIAPSHVRPELPEPISDLCRKCLAKSPEDRYATVEEVRSALIQIIGKGP